MYLEEREQRAAYECAAAGRPIRVYLNEASDETPEYVSFGLIIVI